MFLLVGNHDLPYALAQATAIEIYHTLEVQNVVVADRVGTWRIETKSGPVQVVGLPWPRRSVLLTRDMIRNLTFDQINDRMQILAYRAVCRMRLIPWTHPYPRSWQRM